MKKESRLTLTSMRASLPLTTNWQQQWLLACFSLDPETHSRCVRWLVLTVRYEKYPSERTLLIEKVKIYRNVTCAPPPCEPQGIMRVRKSQA